MAVIVASRWWGQGSIGIFESHLDILSEERHDREERRHGSTISYLRKELVLCLAEGNVLLVRRIYAVARCIYHRYPRVTTRFDEDLDKTIDDYAKALLLFEIESFPSDELSRLHAAG